MDYLIECFKNAREELLFRVQHRDAYLKVHLLVQAVLLGIASGIELAGVKPSKAVPDALAFAVPLSLVFACLFYNENRLIAHLSKYIASLKCPGDSQNWDASAHLVAFGSASFPFRLIAQGTAFLIVPFVLAWSFLWTHPPDSASDWLLVVTNGLSAVVLLVAFVVSVNYLRKPRATDTA